MKIIQVDTLFNIELEQEYVACIGYFDGLHLGHQQLFKETKKMSQQLRLQSACICFDEDPHTLLYPTKTFSYLTPMKQRLKRLNQYGFDVCFLLRFNQQMSNLTIDEFHRLLSKLHVKHIVCGQDFRYGKNASGNIDTFQHSDFIVHSQDLLLDHDKKISSSMIEQHLLAANIEQANQELGYAYTISGTVIHGAKLGSSQLGFPTANLECEEAYIIPKIGVYEGVVEHAGMRYSAMINIGHNPTMNYTSTLSIEAHILDFDKEIYGEHINISFISYLRDEKKFTSIQELIVQLQNDIKKIRE